MTHNQTTIVISSIGFALGALVTRYFDRGGNPIDALRWRWNYICRSWKWKLALLNIVGQLMFWAGVLWSHARGAWWIVTITVLLGWTLFATIFYTSMEQSKGR
jgi:hypothetical protein